MSMTAYYRAQTKRCLALSRSCSDRKQALQLAFMATRYFERAEELEREIPFQRTTRLKKHGSRRAHNFRGKQEVGSDPSHSGLANCAHRNQRRGAVLRGCVGGMKTSACGPRRSSRRGDGGTSDGKRTARRINLIGHGLRRSRAAKASKD